VASYFLNRSINPNLTLGDYLPLGTRGFAQDLVIGGALPDITSFDPFTNALVSGARGAAITQGLNFSARRVVNPALNRIADQRNPGNAPANIRSDFAVGLNRIDIPILDPNRLAVSPNASLNTNPPLRVDVGPLTPEQSLGAFLVSPTGGIDSRTGLGQEFVATPSARTEPLPSGWLTGVLPSRQVSPEQRQLEATADRLGLGDQLPDRQAPFTVFDLTNAPPDVATRAQRVTDLTVTGINFGVPLATAVVDQTLQATGQGDNVPLGTLARGIATGVGVGVPISLAEGRFVPGAFVHPTWQSILADTATRAVLSTAPEPVQQAFGDACSNENPVLNAAAWFVCNVGQNPNQTPPTLPPAGSGGAVVADFVLPSGDGGAPSTGPAVGTVTVPVQEAATTVDRAALLRDMQNGQRELLARGVQADTAAQVFNNLPQIAQRFGLTPREATLALGGTPSDEVGRQIVGQAIVGPRIVGPAIVGEGIVGPCLRGMECWGNGAAGIRYVGPGETPTTPAPVVSTAPVRSTTYVAPTPEPGTRGERPPPPPARAGGNWFWNAATGAWNWLQEANAAAERRMNDTPQEVVRIQRNRFFWPTAYEVRFPDGRQGVYDAGTGDRLSGSGPGNVPSYVFPITPQSGLRIGPFVMPAGPGGVPVRVPVIP
jgi:hypothetical protein